jgi:DNA-binding MarR family transcriptional regulator
VEDQDIRRLLNQVLKDLFYKILRLQEKSVSQTSQNAISRTEMHILEVVQEDEDVTLTHIANTLGITKATASVSVNRLARKGFLEKVPFEPDSRKRILKLTAAGDICCRKHQQFHEMMIESLLREFKVEEYPYVLQSLSALLGFFNRLEH